MALPPLRERGEDIPLLIQHFVDHFARLFKRQAASFDAESMRALCSYRWPGNVRELSNLVERHVALSDGPVMHLESLPKIATGPAQAGGLDADLPDLDTLERRYILKVLEQCGGSREQTAATLGINKSTLWRKLRQYSEQGHLKTSD